MRFDDYITHVDNEEDLPFLRTKLFDVNMRLFKSSRRYKKLILRACTYIMWLCSTELEGYKKPHGMSGANAGIPFNIIAYQANRNTEREHTELMLNPEIVYYGEEKVKSMSNCGSIRLKSPIEIERSEVVTVRWYSTKGDEMVGSFDRKTCSLTIQHEVDHNNGILITDRIVKKEKV